MIKKIGEGQKWKFIRHGGVALNQSHELGNYQIVPPRGKNGKSCGINFNK